MSTPEERQPEAAQPDIDAATATRMLRDADVVREKARGGVDYGTEANIDGWTAAAILVYVLTFLSLFTAPEGAGATGSLSGSSYVPVLLIPFLAMTQLVQGARDGLKVSSAGSFRRPKVIFSMLGLVPFIVLMLLSIASIDYPWWATITAAVLAAAPLAMAAILSTRKARTHEVTAAPAAARSLTPMSRRITIALGLAFGIAGAVTPYWWFSLIVIALMLGLIVLLAGFTSHWGLPSVGSEWGQRQWLSFGASFTLLFALVVVTARTAWNGPALAAVVAVLIAAPLAVSAFGPGRRR